MWSLCHPNIDISKIKAKVLMIHGDQDLAVPLKGDVETTGSIFKNFEVWKGHGHMIPVEDIDRFAKRIAVFFEEK